MMDILDKRLRAQRFRARLKRVMQDRGISQSRLARDIGGDNALEVTTAHEAYSDNPAGERAMDLHNNRVGVSVGVSMSGATDAQLANRCATLVTTGVLVTAPPSPGATYNY